MGGNKKRGYVTTIRIQPWLSVKCKLTPQVPQLRREAQFYGMLPRYRSCYPKRLFLIADSIYVLTL